MALEKIQQANDIKNLNPEELRVLPEEIRAFLVDKTSHSGGHLASNLGVVELTMALHLVCELPKDKIIWDVGHQAYTHKLLTGRRNGFDTLRAFRGMSGFPKRKESDCDAFDTGHSSTSISAGLGLARSRDLNGEDYSVISVIGDGSMTGGMAFEALNNASQLKSNFIIVLNDNNMAISNNVGGMHRYLDRIRTKESYLGFKENFSMHVSGLPLGDQMVDALRKTKDLVKRMFISGMLFEDLGITYLGPVDGHDVKEMVRTFEQAKRVKGAVLVHVCTVKGKGYAPAEDNPSKFHGVGPFDPATGIVSKKSSESYTEVFSKALTVIGEANEKVVAITAAMPDGTGLNRFGKKFPGRYFDVGIAEQHAVTFAAGLAAGGQIPVVAVYSTFLQRAFDQIVHDVCQQDLHVVFAVDRAGLVGQDGETHQGLFDLSYLGMIPNMTVMAPKNRYELIDMLQFAVDYSGPVALRYPRGKAYGGLSDFRSPIVHGKGEFIYEEAEIVLIAIGTMVKWGEYVRRHIKDAGYHCSLVNARFLKPLDEELLRKCASGHRLFVTMEENVASGGLGERISRFIHEEQLDVSLLNITLPDAYVEHGDFASLMEDLGLDEEHLAMQVLSMYLSI